MEKGFARIFGWKFVREIVLSVTDSNKKKKRMEDRRMKPGRRMKKMDISPGEYGQRCPLSECSTETYST